MSKARKAFALRIDPALYDEIERWAQQEFRSVNGQIEFVLRQAVAKRLGRGGDFGAAGNESAKGSAARGDREVGG